MIQLLAKEGYNNLRFVFHNPHTFLWFKTSISEFLYANKRPNKYEFLFNYIYNRPQKLYVYIDGLSKASSLPKYIPKKVRYFVEFYFWTFINKLDFNKFIIITDPNKLKNSDVLFSFLAGNFMHLAPHTEIDTYLLSTFGSIKAKKVIHLSHFGWSIKIGSENMQYIRPDLLVSEANLKKNSDYFRKHYSWYNNDVLILPFVPGSRFKCIREFKDRENYAVATGTIAFKSVDREFTTYFGTPYLHPGRLEIFLHAIKLNKYVKSFISDENIYSIKEIGILNKWRSRLIAVFRLIKRIFHLILTNVEVDNVDKNNTRDYYQLNIVELYNSYKMVVIPEESIGLPGIGFIEAMRCGCAFIGINDPMYSDIGLIDGVNFIAYDGTIDGLISKIDYYQHHEEELSVIALNGYKFVKNMFIQDRVSNIFLNNIKMMLFDNKK